MENKEIQFVKKTSKVQAIGIMTLIGGVIGIFIGLIWGLNVLMVAIGTFGVGLCFAPFPIYSLIMGVMALIKGINMVKDRGNSEKPSKNIAIMQIVNIICFDITNVVLGILTIIFMGDPEVVEFYQDSVEVEATPVE